MRRYARHGNYVEARNDSVRTDDDRRGRTDVKGYPAKGHPGPFRAIALTAAAPQAERDRDGEMGRKREEGREKA